MGVPRGVFLDFPLGHTAGKKHDPALQRNILLEALAAFDEVESPGQIKRLPYRWSQDESWRAEPLRAEDREKKQAQPKGDSRTARDATPQYQYPEDESAFEKRHESGACGTCVGAE